MVAFYFSLIWIENFKNFINPLVFYIINFPFITVRKQKISQLLWNSMKLNIIKFWTYLSWHFVDFNCCLNITSVALIVVFWLNSVSGPVFILIKSIVRVKWINIFKGINIYLHLSLSWGHAFYLKYYFNLILWLGVNVLL